MNKIEIKPLTELELLRKQCRIVYMRYNKND